MRSGTGKPRVTHLALLAATLLVALFLRVYRLSDIPAGVDYDEAGNYILAQEIATGQSRPVFIRAYAGREAVFYWLAAASMRLLGRSLFAFRLTSALCGVGTVLLAYLLHKLGVDNEFKLSVFMGNDNPYAALWTLIGAKLFSRDDGSTSLIGFNWSNSVNNETIELTAQVRGELGLEKIVRFEHHITETFKHIVRQPYDRTNELVELADHVANISAKHEGGNPEIDETREHPSDILDYFRDKSEVIESGEMPALERNFLDKHNALNRTARALTENGLSFVAAQHLHR